MRRGGWTASLALVAAALLFGSTFLVVQDAVESAEPLPFLAVRFAIGAAVLLPLALRRGTADLRTPGLLRAGALAGLALTAGYVLQTVGLQYTTSSVSAFLTYLLVVFVPLIVAGATRRLPPWQTAVGVALAVGGLALLGGGPDVGTGRGELLTLACALAFAVHLLALADAAPRLPVAALSAVQFAVVAGVLVVPGLLTGGYAMGRAALAAAVYTGVATTGLALGLQAWGQRRVSATRAALILMLEPVSAAVLGFASGERLGAAG
ncbi:MAG TPA: DMT family transporter, partial [Acidimicrobiales bacterium]|nr:DMT family transporter [Acidimicrobiales bacterium]